MLIAHLAIAEVEVVHRVAEADAAQRLHVGVLRPREERLRPVRAPHVLVHPRFPLQTSQMRTVRNLRLRSLCGFVKASAVMQACAEMLLQP